MAQNEMNARPALPERVRAMEGVGLAASKTGALRASIVSSGHDERNGQFRDEVPEPYCGWLRQAHFGDGDQPSEPSKQHAKSQEVDQKALLADCKRRPQTNDARGEVYAGHEAVNVV